MQSPIVSSAAAASAAIVRTWFHFVQTLVEPGRLESTPAGSMPGSAPERDPGESPEANVQLPSHARIQAKGHAVADVTRRVAQDGSGPDCLTSPLPGRPDWRADPPGDTVLINDTRVPVSVRLVFGLAL
jgi:hypothetical protein